MSKLPKSHKFIDLSDYGRPIAKVISLSLKETIFTPIHVTIGFIVAGLLAVLFIINDYYWLAAIFLIIKSILDAADGELARIRKTPSYTGRYLDSVADILLNLIIFLSIWFITNASITNTIIAFLGIQLQGTLYNYYYVIMRNQLNGDSTSRIFENSTPIAMKGEKQKNVDFLFGLYKIFYGGFDKIIYFLDKHASDGKTPPKWLMTAISTFGLGFQLLIIAVMLITGLKEYIIPFFIGYSSLIFIFIAIRKLL
ncbi:MAG: CDP-alcohol phosphatidyltransferase family protein [Polaribacter sp.]|nr:CDP-alcohol phosphatidyltransferase family protein [Polaribacter sp.]